MVEHAMSRDEEKQADEAYAALTQDEWERMQATPRLARDIIAEAFRRYDDDHAHQRRPFIVGALWEREHHDLQ